jgi:hypothetical protein
MVVVALGVPKQGRHQTSSQRRESLEHQMLRTRGCHHSEASLGVMIESEHFDQCLLTTVSHLFHEQKAAEIIAKRILGVDENTPLPTVVYGPRGNELPVFLLAAAIYLS